MYTPKEREEGEKKRKREEEKSSLRSINNTSHGTLTINRSSGDLQTQIGVNVNHKLDLATSLDALNSQLSNRLLRLPDNLTGLFFLILIRVEVRVFVISRLLLLGLGLGLGDLDVTLAFADANENIAAFLGSDVLSDAASGECGLGVQEGCEFGAAARRELNTDGVVEVRGGSNCGVDRLLDVLLVELGDQRGLDSCATGSQLGGVDGTGRDRGSEDVGLLGEHVADQLGDLGSVRSTTGKDNLYSMLAMQCTSPM